MTGLLALSVSLGLTLLAIALLVAFWRLVLGPSVADRIVALDVIAATIVAAAVLYAIDTGLAVFIDVALVIALVTFVGTLALARHIESGEEG